MPQIVGKQIGSVGYGLMGKSRACFRASHTFILWLTIKIGLTWRPNPPSEEQAFQAMRAALANGCNFVRETLD